MGSSAEKTWTAILGDLQQMMQHSGAAGVSGAVGPPRIHQHVMRLAQQPPYPHATWKKLVSNLKVGCALRMTLQTLSRQRCMTFPVFECKSWLLHQWWHRNVVRVGGSCSSRFGSHNCSFGHAGCRCGPPATDHKCLHVFLSTCKMKT